MAEERPQRRLAAILAADVVGYSRLMEVDEAGTLASLKARRKDVLNPLVSKHRGRIFKTNGDGVLVEFGSAVNAVQCAIELQDRMGAANTPLPGDRRILLRIGINLGDVIVEGGDLYGDGVNVAARLQELADPAGICITAKVHDEVRRKLDLAFEDTGEQMLKNLAEPLRVYRLAGERAPGPATRHPPLPAKPSIAVLPFTNLSGDSEQQYFSDGITEDVISGLARLPWLFVIARDSSFTYKGKTVDVKQVGRELGVRYLLEGSVRRAEQRVRITSQLVDAASGAHIWTDRFDGMLTDIFDLQDRITASVVGAIEPKLRRAEIERARRKPTENVDAYDLFLRAVALNNTRSAEDNREALVLAKRAIALDPRYAAAHGLGAFLYVRRRAQGWMSYADPLPAEGIEMARLAAETGPDNPEALWMAGLALALLAGRFDDGLALVQRSLALNPNSANGWMASGMARAYLGDTEAAIADLERSARLSPLDPLAYATWQGFAVAHFVAGRYEEASAWCDRALRDSPNYVPALRLKVAICGLLGKAEDGRTCVERLLSLNPDTSVSSLRMYYETFLKAPGRLEALVMGLCKAGVPQ